MKATKGRLRGRKPSRLIRDTREDMQGFFKDDLIGKRKMVEFGLLYPPKPPSYTARRIRAIRNKLNLSQDILAIAVNASLVTVRKWESGQRRPTGPAQRLLYILETKGLEGLV